MNESKFSTIVCAIVKSFGGHVSRVEAHASASGIPDIDACIGGKEFHVELKVGGKLKNPELRASQVRWFNARHKAGGKPFFLCYDNDIDKVYLVWEIEAKELAGSQSINKWRESAYLTFSMGDQFRQGLVTFIRNKL